MSQPQHTESDKENTNSVDDKLWELLSSASKPTAPNNFSKNVINSINLHSEDMNTISLKSVYFKAAAIAACVAITTFSVISVTKKKHTIATNHKSEIGKSVETQDNAFTLDLSLLEDSHEYSIDTNAFFDSFANDPFSVAESELLHIANL